TDVQPAQNTFTVQRGYNGTTAAPHAGGAAVFLATDQRGAAAVTSGHTNIGAYAGSLSPNAFAPPAATLNATAVTPANAAGETPYDFTVVFQGATFVAMPTVRLATVQIESPLGDTYTARLQGVQL